jgi:protocatechuate 3,4-dioxygenase beta subunit
MLRLILAASIATSIATSILTAAALADQAVEVRVVNASTGAGIPDVPLKFLQSGQFVYAGATDGNGRFRIEAAKEGTYTVYHEVPNFWPAHDPPWVTFQVAGGADPVRLEIEMYQSGKISGRVLDAAGKPVPN